MLKKLFAASLVVVLLFGLVSCDEDKGKKDEEGKKEEKQYTAADIVMESENFRFTRGEFSYQFYMNYQDFLRYNQSYMQHFGFDTNTSLKEQSYSDDQTWFDYIAEPSLEYMRQILVLCEEALASGIELDAQDQEEIDTALKSYEQYAADYEHDLNVFLTELFGEDVSLDIMRSYMEKDRLAYKYRDVILAEYDFSEDALAEYLAENTDQFYYIDYLSYAFDEDTDVNAASRAQEMAEATDSASFETYMRTYEMETLKKGEDEIDTASLSSEYIRKDADSAFSVWAFDEATAGKTYVDKNEVDGIYTVYLLTKAPYLQDYATKNFRYVYMTLDTYGTYEKAQQKAAELVKTWREGDADSHSFGELAYNYSEDGATSYVGGLQENLGQSPTKFPDSVVNWLYNPDRQTGDLEILRGEEAYFIVYFEGDGQIQWKNAARQALEEDKYIADMEIFSERHETKINEEVANSLYA